jgi:hypothetical protein
MGFIFAVLHHFQKRDVHVRSCMSDHGAKLTFASAQLMSASDPILSIKALREAPHGDSVC